MTIAALITEGIGPGGSIKYFLTTGLDIQLAPSMSATLSASGSLTGALVPFVPPTPPPIPPVPPPIGQTVFPHDDYDDDYRPWFQRPKNAVSANEERLQRMREEIGLLPRKAVKQAERQIEKAVEAIIATPAAVRSEKVAFETTASFEKHYRQALRKVVKKAREEDAETEFRERVRKRLAIRAEELKEQARQRSIQEADEALLLQIASEPLWL